MANIFLASCETQYEKYLGPLVFQSVLKEKMENEYGSSWANMLGEHIQNTTGALAENYAKLLGNREGLAVSGIDISLGSLILLFDEEFSHLLDEKEASALHQMRKVRNSNHIVDTERQSKEWEEMQTEYWHSACSALKMALDSLNFEDKLRSEINAFIQGKTAASIRGDEKESMLDEANEALSMGKEEEAIEILERIVEKHNWHKAMLRLSDIYRKSQREDIFDLDKAKEYAINAGFSGAENVERLVDGIDRAKYLYENREILGVEELLELASLHLGEMFLPRNLDTIYEIYLEAEAKGWDKRREACREFLIPSLFKYSRKEIYEEGKWIDILKEITEASDNKKNREKIFTSARELGRDNPSYADVLLKLLIDAAIYKHNPFKEYVKSVYSLHENCTNKEKGSFFFACVAYLVYFYKNVDFEGTLKNADKEGMYADGKVCEIPVGKNREEYFAYLLNRLGEEYDRKAFWQIALDEFKESVTLRFWESFLVNYWDCIEKTIEIANGYVIGDEERTVFKNWYLGYDFFNNSVIKYVDKNFMKMPENCRKRYSSFEYNCFNGERTSVFDNMRERVGFQSSNYVNGRFNVKTFKRPNQAAYWFSCGTIQGHSLSAESLIELYDEMCNNSATFDKKKWRIVESLKQKYYEDIARREQEERTKEREAAERRKKRIEEINKPYWEEINKKKEELKEFETQNLELKKDDGKYQNEIKWYKGRVDDKIWKRKYEEEKKGIGYRLFKKKRKVKPEFIKTTIDSAINLYAEKLKESLGRANPYIRKAENLFPGIYIDFKYLSTPRDKDVVAEWKKVNSEIEKKLSAERAEIETIVKAFKIEMEEEMRKKWIEP